MNFEAVQKHSMEIYQSALVWIPKKSLIRKTYVADVSRVPKVVLGLSDSWGHAELIMQNRSRVRSVGFSQDGSRVVSGSYDKTLRIWNVTTGEMEAELKGHTGWVTSVAFSQDGSQVISGSDDKTTRIWNVMTGDSQSESMPTSSPDGRVTIPEGFRFSYPLQQPMLSMISTSQLSDVMVNG